MSVTIRDLATAEELAKIVGAEIEVYAPDGRLLGHFTPAHPPEMLFPELGMNLDDMNQRLNDPNAQWVTGEEVLARLRSLRGNK